MVLTGEGRAFCVGADLKAHGAGQRTDFQKRQYLIKANDVCKRIRTLSRPVIAMVALFTFLGTWKDFLGPLIYLRDEALYTVSIGLTRYQAGGYTQPRWPWLMAASMTTLIPILILFFLAQRTFIEGISLTGIKG